MALDVSEQVDNQTSASLGERSREGGSEVAKIRNACFPFGRGGRLKQERDYLLFLELTPENAKLISYRVFDKSIQLFIRHLFIIPSRGKLWRLVDDLRRLHPFISLANLMVRVKHQEIEKRKQISQECLMQCMGASPTLQENHHYYES